MEEIIKYGFDDFVEDDFDDFVGQDGFDGFFKENDVDEDEFKDFQKLFLKLNTKNKNKKKKKMTKEEFLKPHEEKLKKKKENKEKIELNKEKIELNKELKAACQKGDSQKVKELVEKGANDFESGLW